MKRTADLISRNPYRTLGVYVGASFATESANRSRILAYLKVGRDVQMPMLADDALPPAVRTAESVADAVQALSLPGDRVRHALMWFTETDKPWGRLLNGAVGALVAGDTVKALGLYDALISDKETFDAFISDTTHGLNPADADKTADYLIAAIEPEDRAIRKYIDSLGDHSGMLIYSRLCESGLFPRIKETLKFRYIKGNINLMIQEFNEVVERVAPMLEKVRSLASKQIPGMPATGEIEAYTVSALCNQMYNILKALEMFLFKMSVELDPLCTRILNNSGECQVNPWTFEEARQMPRQLELLLDFAMKRLDIKTNPGSDYYGDLLQFSYAASYLDRAFEDYSPAKHRARKIRIVAAVAVWLGILAFFFFRMM